MSAKPSQQQAPKGLQDAKSLAALVGMSEADVRSLTKKGVLSAQDGLYDPARALVSITRHLVKTRDTAEAKARAAAAEAELKERRLKAATSSFEPSNIAEPAKKHGSSKYTKAAAERICKVVAEGGSLRAAARAEGLSHGTIREWLKRYADFSAQYARACEVKHRGYEEEIDEAVAEAERAASDPVCGSLRIQAARLRIDTRKWQLGKMLPKIYGESSRVEVHTTGSSGGITLACSGDSLEAALDKVAQRQAKFAALAAKEQEEQDAAE